MISSVFTLKESNMIPENLMPIKQTKLEESYFNSSLNFVLEMHEELLSEKQSFYKTILEVKEDNPYIINEAVNNIIMRLKAILKKILAYIETLIKRAITQIAKYIQADKYILKMKSTIEKFTDNDKFKINGYDFTLDNGVPVVDIPGFDIVEISKNLESIENADIAQKLAILSILNNNMADTSKVDDICAQIINSDHSVPETSFSNAVFCVFRDGCSEEQTIEIKRSDVMRALKDYQEYKSKIKVIESDKNKLNVKFKELETQTNKILSINMKTDGSSNLDSNLETALSQLVNTWVNNIQKISNLYVLVFGIKLDALNASVLQDKAILYGAINKVQSNIKNNTFVKESVNYEYTDYAIYKQYMLEKHFMNINQKRFIQECLALSESNIPELKSIQEDLKMDKQNFFEKLKEILKSLLEKFTGKIVLFAKKNKEYLEKNKDTILNKEAPTYTLNNMPTYSLGRKNISDWKVNTSVDFNKLISGTEQDVQKMILPEYDGQSKFADFAKRYFLCNNTENKDIKSTDNEVKMENLYNYCINIEDMANKVKADRASFDNVTKSLQSSIEKVNESYMDEFGNQYIYSSVLEMFINEDGEEKEPETEIKSNDTANNAKSDSKLDISIDKQDDNKNKDNDPNKDPEKKEEKSSNKKKAEESAKWYIKNLQLCIAAKVTAIQKIYSEYMKIMRYHVQSLTSGSAGEHEDALKPLMKEYLDAGDDADKKKTAADKIISYFKSKMSRTIDAHDVEILVNKNKSKLG